VMCGGSILSCCPRNPHGHERALKEEDEDFKRKSYLSVLKHRKSKQNSKLRYKMLDLTVFWTGYFTTLFWA